MSLLILSSFVFIYFYNSDDTKFNLKEGNLKLAAGGSDQDSYLDSVKEKIWEPIHYIGNKEVRELCNPINKTWTDEIPHYKNCTNCYNTTIEANEIDKEAVLYPNGTYYKIKETCYDYSCIDYIEKIEHTNETIGCTPTGQVDVDGKIIAFKGYFCKLIREEAVCVHHKAGGEHSAWYSLEIDNRLGAWRRDLITDKITFDNKLKTRLESVSLES